ncbi:MAG TPA: IPT/TIG domain-containing protein, partial [Solirubrobacteraceae bacterium]|nr:IPT/TIG domain-containing protein [Solirubrobacteraceae bacterium]
MRPVLLALVCLLGVALVPVAAAKSSDSHSTKPSISSVSPSSGATAGGTKVTLRGKNFTKVKYVEFGRDRGAKLKVDSATKLTVDSPKHGAGKVSIVVVTRAGSSRGASFTYKTPAAKGASGTPPVQVTPPTTPTTTTTPTSPPPTPTLSWSSAQSSALPLVGSVTEDGDLDDVSCVTNSWCLAVDGSGDSMLYNNGAWSQPTFFETDTYVVGETAVSCASESLCVAVDDAGSIWVTSNGGESWVDNADVDENSLVSISCAASTDFCAAVDIFGTVLTFTVTGETVGSVETYDPVPTGDSAQWPVVSCASANSCVLADQLLDASDDSVIQTETWSGSSWSSGGTFDSATTGMLPGPGGIDCFSSSTCIIGDETGNVFETEDGGADWSEVLAGA